MRGRWEISDQQWEVLEPFLRFNRRPDGRGRPPQETRAVLNGVLWILGTGAQWRELPDKYPPYQTCHRRFQQWVRKGQLKRALQALAEALHEEGVLNSEEGFLDGSFASAKKGGWRWGRPSVAKAPKSWPLPLITVFLSPYLCKPPRPTNRN